EAAATGEIIYRLLADMGIPLTESMAEALYVAIATDTGSFKFENTTPATHRTAAALLEHQINPAVLSQRVFDERPLSYYILLKEALSSLELHGDNRIALITVSKEMLERCGTTVEEIDGIINYTRDIEGIELGILIYVESPEEVKVGFRSRRADVSLLAQQFNGGGHARAAGCRIHGAYAPVKEKILLQAQKLLQETAGKEG
ncbi:MAG TPA: DHHA1 domain-containing protein, partial [Bacillota bacterium]|nr:DHHA1 domain-containing protein [Bacillota bacterium]